MTAVRYFEFYPGGGKYLLGDMPAAEAAALHMYATILRRFDAAHSLIHGIEATVPAPTIGTVPADRVSGWRAASGTAAELTGRLRADAERLDDAYTWVGKRVTGELAPMQKHLQEIQGRLEVLETGPSYVVLRKGSAVSIYSEIPATAVDPLKKLLGDMVADGTLTYAVLFASADAMYAWATCRGDGVLAGYWTSGSTPYSKEEIRQQISCGLTLGSGKYQPYSELRELVGSWCTGLP